MLIWLTILKFTEALAMCNSKAVDKWLLFGAGQMNVLAPLKFKDCKVTFDKESNVATLQMSHIDTRMFLDARSL